MEVDELKTEYDKALAKIDSLSYELSRVNSVLDAMKKRLFSPKSEPYHHPGQGTLFNEAEALTSDQKPNDEVEVKAHTKKKKCRKTISDSLPREDKVFEPDPKSLICGCGCEMSKIGEDVSEKIAVIPKKITIHRNIRPKYACKNCKSKVVQSPVEKALIPKSFASPSLLAHIITSKYVDGLPLYR